LIAGIEALKFGRLPNDALGISREILPSSAAAKATDLVEVAIFVGAKDARGAL
jgi:hypothetical protein